VTGWIDFFLNPERFLLQALTGLAFFERRPHAIGLIYNHMSVGLICDVVPLFGLAQRHHDEALAIAIRNGQPLALGHAHLGMGFHAHSLGRLHAALDAYEKSATIFHDIGHIRGWGGATMMRAWACEDRGDFEQALSFADAVSAVGAESSDPQVRSWGLQRRAVGRRHIAHLEEAIADLETAVTLSKQIPDYAGVVQGLALLGLCHLDRGDRVQARRLVEEANQIRRERKLRGIWVGHAVMADADVSIAELDNPGPDRRALRKRAARACREARKFGKVARHWLPAALRLQGNLHWRDGNLVAARQYWRRSVEAADRIRAESPS
jgi:tetratricopeptide (TPR) repeat protein